MKLKIISNLKHEIKIDIPLHFNYNAVSIILTHFNAFIHICAKQM